MPKTVTSLSARRAWIEITLVQIIISGYARSLSARRAWIEIERVGEQFRVCGVALRKESVDRNHCHLIPNSGTFVALRKESVDRNIKLDVSYSIIVKSLSARRAWIEIAKSTPEEAKRWSLSARRAWIEMQQCRL